MPFITQESRQQENDDEHRGLRARFDTTTSTSADHRAAAFVLAGNTALSGSVDVIGPERLGLTERAQRWSSINGRMLSAYVLPDGERVA